MQITQAQADQVVQIFGFDSLVDDYEANELGHVYQLEDGTTLVIGYTGSAHHMNGDDQRLYGVDFEQAGPASVRYWMGRTDKGVVQFDEESEPDACPGCGWMPGDGINPKCDHPHGFGYWKAECAEELAREEAACAA